MKRLIIRLSSLGDVILATSSLSALGPGENHWVVCREYSGLLKGHPRVARVWEFDRKNGSLISWLALCEKLWKEDFSEVLDLHSTLRSLIAKIYFELRSKISKRQVLWKTIGKERVQLNGFFVAKKFWPKKWYPSPLVIRFARLAGGTGAERPDLRHLICDEGELSAEFRNWLKSHPDYICVMPASKWDAKKWSLRGYFEVLKKAGIPVVVLGEKSDRESVLLVKLLEQAAFPFFSGIGVFPYRQLATALARSRGYLGNDTGLGHLAEAVGVSVVTVFGPTRPEMGFGPWREGSRAVGLDLWCRPCGKDGRFCFRVKNQYACQKDLPSGQVARELEGILSGVKTGA